MSRNQTYYLSLENGTDNVKRTDRELLINCCGLAELPHPFESYQQNGRKDYYLQYMVGGEMDVWLEEEMVQMVPGQAILYYPHTPYRYAMRGQEPVRYYWIHFTGSLAEAFVEKSQLENQVMLDVGLDDILQSHFEDLFHHFVVQEPCFYFQTEALLLTIVLSIQNKLVAGIPSDLPVKRRVDQSLSYIHKNLGQDLSVESLADMENLSVSRYRNVFKESTGLSTLHYIIALRINQARQLLVQTDLPISEIAAGVGYQDAMYFSRLFKIRMGQSPTGYRRMHRL